MDSTPGNHGTFPLRCSWLNSDNAGNPYWPTATDYLVDLRARVGEYERKARRRQRLTFDEARDLRRLLACLADVETGRKGLSTADQSAIEDAGGRLRQALADLAKLEGLEAAPLLGEAGKRLSIAWAGFLALCAKDFEQQAYASIIEHAHHYTAKAKAKARLTPDGVDRLYGALVQPVSRVKLLMGLGVDDGDAAFLAQPEMSHAYRRIERMIPLLASLYGLKAPRFMLKLGEGDAFWQEFRRRSQQAATATPDANGNDGERMTDSDLLKLCELPADAPADVVEMVKLAAALVERDGDGPAGAAVALASAMGRAGGWSVQSLPFGYDGPRVEHEGWIKRNDLAVKLAQLGGLIVGGRFNADCANVAVAEALRNYWLREQRFDTWKPGMKSGSGWTTVVQAQPAGIARARELLAAPAEAPRPWQAPPAPAPAPAPGATAEAEDAGDVGGPTEDPHDNRVAWWAGKRIYLGNDTEVSRLFWLLAKPVGAAANLAQVQRAIDGMETTRDMRPDDVRKAAQRLRKVVSKLRAALREAGLDDHVLLVKDGPQDAPQYIMVPRFGK